MIGSDARKTDKFLADLEANASYIMCPSLLVTLAIESTDRTLAQRDYESYRRLVDIRGSLGMDPFPADGSRPYKSDPDLTEVTKSLTALSEWVASCNWHQQCLSQMVNETFRLHDSSLTKVPGEHRTSVQNRWHAVRERLEYKQALYARNELKYVTRQTQVQAQIQTVPHISQTFY